MLGSCAYLTTDLCWQKISEGWNRENREDVMCVYCVLISCTFDEPKSLSSLFNYEVMCFFPSWQWLVNRTVSVPLTFESCCTPHSSHPALAVQRGVPARKPVLHVAPERGQSAGGSGGADRGLHWFGLHQPWAAAGHPKSVPAGSPGHSAARARLGWGGMLAWEASLAQMHAKSQEYS